MKIHGHDEQQLRERETRRVLKTPPHHGRSYFKGAAGNAGPPSSLNTLL